MRVVIDTSIFIASFWKGTSRTVVELWKKGEITLCASEAILKEYFHIIPRFNRLNKEAGKLLSLFKARKNMKMVTPSKKLKVVQKDPADNKFLECAIETKAEYIISADRHLKDFKKHQGVKIVSSGNFLKDRVSPERQGKGFNLLISLFQKMRHLRDKSLTPKR